MLLRPFSPKPIISKSFSRSVTVISCFFPCSSSSVRCPYNIMVTLFILMLRIKFEKPINWLLMFWQKWNIFKSNLFTFGCTNEGFFILNAAHRSNFQHNHLGWLHSVSDLVVVRLLFFLWFCKKNETEADNPSKIIYRWIPLEYRWSTTPPSPSHALISFIILEKFQCFSINSFCYTLKD